MHAGDGFLLSTTGLLLTFPLRTSGVMYANSGMVEAVGE